MADDPLQKAQTNQQGLQLPGPTGFSNDQSNLLGPDNSVPKLVRPAQGITFDMSKARPISSEAAPAAPISEMAPPQNTQPKLVRPGQGLTFDLSKSQPLDAGASAPEPAANKELGILETWRDELVGPNTLAGAWLRDAYGSTKEIGKGLYEMHKAPNMSSGQFDEGQKKVMRGVIGDVPAGSRMEKIVQFFDPTFQGVNVTPEQWDQANPFNKPLINSSQFIDIKEHPMLKAAVESAEGMTTLPNALIVAGTGGLGAITNATARTVASRLISAGFTADMVYNNYKQNKEAQKAMDAGDAAGAEYHMTHAVIGSMFAALGAAHATGAEVPFAGEFDKKVAGKVADVAGAAKDAVVDTATAAKNKVVGATVGAVETGAELGRKAVGAGGGFSDAIREASKPSKTKAQDYDKDLKAAEPQLREIARNNPKIETPKEMYDAIDGHILNEEARLKARAQQLQGQNGIPEEQAILSGVEDEVRDALNTYFTKDNVHAFEKADYEKAVEKVINRIRAGNEEEPRDPSLFEAENLKTQFNKETKPAFDSDAAVSAEREAKIIANSIIRERINQKYEDLGVEGVKEWRQQEAPLINVRDQLEKAFGKSKDMGNWNVLTALLRSKWGVLGAILNHPSVLAADIGLDYVRDIRTNPNRWMRRAVDIAGREPAPAGVQNPRSVAPGQIPQVESPIRETGSLRTAPPPEAPPEIKQEIDGTGLQYIGSDSMGLSHFHDPETNHTYSVMTDRVTKESLLDKMATKAELDAKSPKEEIPYAQPVNKQVEQASKDVRKALSDFKKAKQEADLAANLPAKLAARQKIREAIQQFETAKQAHQELNNAWFEARRQTRQAADDAYRENFEPLIPGDTPHAFSDSTDVPIDETMGHEYGHAAVESLIPELGDLGFKVSEIRSNKHPDLIKDRGTIAAGRLDYGKIASEETGRVFLEDLQPHLGGLMDMAALGGAVEEMAYGTKIKDNTGLDGDLKYMSNMMDALQIPKKTQKILIDKAYENAKTKLKTPGVLDIIKKYANGREAGLTDEGLHATRQRVKAMNDEIREILGKTNAEEQRTRPTGQNSEGDKTAVAGKDRGTAAVVPEPDVARTETAPEKGRFGEVREDLRDPEQIGQQNLTGRELLKEAERELYPFHDNVETDTYPERSYITPEGSQLSADNTDHFQVQRYYPDDPRFDEEGAINQFLKDTGAVRTGKYDNTMLIHFGDRMTPEQITKAINSFKYWEPDTSNVQIYSDARGVDVKIPNEKLTAGAVRRELERVNGAAPEPEGTQTISTRFPNAANSTENPLEHRLTVTGDLVYKNPVLAKKMSEIVRTYPGMKFTKAELKTPEGTLTSFVRQVKDNLKYLYDQSTPEEQFANRGWYDGAHNFTKELADQHGLEHRQTAGVTASLSPQKDWDMNVSLAKRVMDTYLNKKDQVTTPEMVTKAQELSTRMATKETREGFLETVKSIEGKRLQDLTDSYEKSIWLRLYDEAHNPREFEKIGPDGKPLGLRQTKGGANSRVAWGGFSEIAKAISILDNGSRENISNALGLQHKVRSFYNNIIEPNSVRGDTTIDTHAVAAGLLRPLSGNSKEVLHNFQGPASRVSGIKGTYALYQDAYRQAAKELDITNPRELQSVVWEKIRKLYPSTFKTEANNAAIDAIWRKYSDGKISLDKARLRVAEFGRNPRVDEAKGNSVDAAKLSRPELSRKPADAGRRGESKSSERSSRGKSILSGKGR